MSEQNNSTFQVPEGVIDIPRGREGLSSVETARARWGVADVFTSEQPDIELQQLPPQTRLKTIGIENNARRNKRLESVISLSDDHAYTEKPSASIFKKALSLLTGNVPVISRFAKGTTERELIQLESEIGSQLFGPIPAGNRREFFNLDATTWIWHEEWTDVESGKPTQLTTRYEVHDNGVLKVQEGAQYSFIEGEELENLVNAAQLYNQRVSNEIYTQSDSMAA